MERYPIFHKESPKLRQPDLMKNIWCPYYEDCIDEAATNNSLMDCSHCKHSDVNYEENWRDNQICHFL